MFLVSRISERSAAKVEGHRLFEGEADGGKVRHAWTHLDVGERCAQRLAVPEDTNTACRITATALIKPIYTLFNVSLAFRSVACVS